MGFDCCSSGREEVREEVVSPTEKLVRKMDTRTMVRAKVKKTERSEKRTVVRSTRAARSDKAG